MGILYYIVKSRPNNSLGRETITNWLEESSSDEDIKKISQNITLTVLPYTEPDERCDSNKSHKENKPGIIEYSASSGSLTYHSGSTVTAAPPHQHPRISPESKSLESPSKYKLLERIPDCRSGFVYRNHERAAIGNIFAGGEHVVFLYGEAGQGKTELAKQYASSYRKNNPNAAVVFAVYTDNIETTIRDRITIPGLSQDKEETNKAYYLRKLKKLMAISDKNTLLIIDDFNVDCDPELESFLEGPYKVIFTTRNPHHQYKDREVEVGILGDVNALLSVFREYYETESGSSLPLDDIPYVRELIERFHCHTYMVELLAKQLAASYISAEQLLQRYEQ